MMSINRRTLVQNTSQNKFSVEKSYRQRLLIKIKTPKNLLTAGNGIS
jgi:hypothetical protein